MVRMEAKRLVQGLQSNFLMLIGYLRNFPLSYFPSTSLHQLFPTPLLLMMNGDDGMVSDIYVM
jgi:hypothetical protein